MALSGYFVALFLTEIIETAVALALGYRKAHEIAAVLLVNLFTHPLLHFYALLHRYYEGAPMGMSLDLMLEVGVVFAEWGLLGFALKERSNRSLFFLSAAMNTCSFVTGLFIMNTRAMQIFAT